MIWLLYLHDLLVIPTSLFSEKFFLRLEYLLIIRSVKNLQWLLEGTWTSITTGRVLILHPKVLIWVFVMYFTTTTDLGLWRFNNQVFLESDYGNGDESGLESKPCAQYQAALCIYSHWWVEGRKQDFYFYFYLFFFCFALKPRNWASWNQLEILRLGHSEHHCVHRGLLSTRSL